MGRVWNSYKHVDSTVNSIKEMMQRTGTLPEVFVRACQETLEKASRGLVQRFYERLTTECPEALPYFVRKEDAHES